MFSMLRNIVFVSSLVYLVNAYSAGAPSERCGDLIPGHRTGQVTILAQNKIANSVPSPYSIAMEGSSTVVNGERVQITLAGSSGFQGFIIVGETIDANRVRRRVGSFTSLSNLVKTTCADETGLTHNSKEVKRNMRIEWIAPPAPFTGFVSFWGSFVRDYNTFWVEIKGTLTVNVVPAQTTNPPTQAAGEVPTRPDTTNTHQHTAALIPIESPTKLSTSTEGPTTRRKNINTVPASTDKHSPHGKPETGHENYDHTKSFRPNKAGSKTVRAKTGQSRVQANNAAVMQVSYLCYMAVWIGLIMM